MKSRSTSRTRSLLGRRRWAAETEALKASGRGRRRLGTDLAGRTECSARADSLRAELTRRRPTAQDVRSFAIADVAPTCAIRVGAESAALASTLALVWHSVSASRL